MSDPKRAIWRLIVSLLMLFFTFSIAGIAHGQIYKWIDKNGVIHFGQTPSQNTGAAVKIEATPSIKNVTPATMPPQSEGKKVTHDVQKPPALEERTQVNQEATVELFSTSWCPYCRKTREFFQAQGIPFVEYDIEADAEAAHRKQAIDSRPGVPLVVINGQPIFGFVPDTYMRVLGSRQY